MIPIACKITNFPFTCLLSIKALLQSIKQNTEDLLVIYAPHISMLESHYAMISVILNSFHDIIAVRSVSAILCLALKPLHINHKSSLLRGCKERMGNKCDHQIFEKGSSTHIHFHEFEVS